MDDNYSKGLRLWVTAGGIVFFIFQTTAFGLTHLSFGKGVDLSFGPIQTKNTWVSAEIGVPFSGKIRDIDLAFDITHTSFCDLQIFIDSPSGTTACINYYDMDNFVVGRKIDGWIEFDQRSPFYIDSTLTFDTVPVRPNGPDKLSSFYDQQSFGIWTVRICDAVYGNTGTVNGVRIDMIINPEPSTFLLAAAGALFLFRRQPR
jgi:subtilisin-like proprotein convertase family protein